MFHHNCTLLQDRRLTLDRLSERLSTAQSLKLQAERNSLARLSAALDALSPLKVLARGYATVQNENGDFVTKAKMLCAGQKIAITFQDDIVPAVIAE